jgi:hypothetical protein
MDLAADYIEKWIALRKQAEWIDRSRAADSIVETYRSLNIPVPPLVYASNPDRITSIFLQHKLIERNNDRDGMSIQPQLARKQEVQLKNQLGLELARVFTDNLLHPLSRSIREQTGGDIESQLWVSVEHQLRQQIGPISASQMRNTIACQDWLCYACKFDYCITELTADIDRQLWHVFQNLVINCDWFIPFSKLCVIGDVAVIDSLP